MAVAGIFIAIAFVALAAFSFLLIIPGLLLYRAGIKNAYTEMTAKTEIKTIDITLDGEATKPADIGSKGKAMLKSAARTLRNYLNRFAD